MSRAFVKEQEDNAPDDLPELSISAHPNYVTPRGLGLLHERMDAALRGRGELEKDADAVNAAAALAHVKREIRWLQARVAGAIPVDLAKQPHDRVTFGATVQLADAGGNPETYSIVGEDEADPEHGLVSWVSPLGMALVGARVGDEVTWKRPAGDRVIEVLAIRYGDR